MLDDIRKAFRPLPIVVPPASINAEFVHVAQAQFAPLIENEKQAQTLASLRDTLPPRLITGRVRLPEAEAELDDNPLLKEPVPCP